MVKWRLSAALTLALFVINAQNPQQDKEFIRQMCGCYEVDFEYAETFSDVKEYQYHDRYSARGLELIFVDEETEGKLVLQHLLIMGDNSIIKHWRQDWIYQNQDLLTYVKNLEWKHQHYTPEQVTGTWTQKVYQVDDSPRYEGFATWLNVDGKTYWESQVTAPLPRREYTKRSDYNVMQRNNKHRLTSSGHVHELDNAKVVRTAAGDSVLVWEKGLNTYTRVSDSSCDVAVDWWNRNRMYWVDVRTVWASKLSASSYVNLKYEVNDERLWQRLFDLGDELLTAESYNSKQAQTEIEQVITLYLTTEPSPWLSTGMAKQKTEY